MARYERSGKEDGQLVPGAKIKMRRDENGKLVPVLPKGVKIATTEAKPKPPQADDPRSANARNVPPYGAGL